MKIPFRNQKFESVFYLMPVFISNYHSSIFLQIRFRCEIVFSPTRLEYVQKVMSLITYRVYYGNWTKLLGHTVSLKQNSPLSLFRLVHHGCKMNVQYTVWPKSLDPFHTVSYSTAWVKTSGTYSL